MNSGFGTRLGVCLDRGETVAFIGVYDVLSASLAARHFDGVLISGSAFAATHYGVPEVGFIAWSEVATFVRRLRALLPAKHIVVDLDSGCSETDVACHAVALMEAAGASAVILGDRDRRTQASEPDAGGLLDVEVFAARLTRALQTRRDLFVVARTMATESHEVSRRAAAYAETGADVVLADRAAGLSCVSAIRRGSGCRVAVNQHVETGSPVFTHGELRQAGVSMAIYASSCFSAAERAIRDAMEALRATDGPRTPAAKDRPTRPGYPWTAPAHVSAL